MSNFYAKHKKRFHPKYKDGRTKQAFRESCDINKILARAARTGTISHMAKHQAEYGDFAEFDFLEAQTTITRGQQIFDELPAEIKREFGQSPEAFFNYVNDPANADKLAERLPELAAPGTQHIRPGTGRKLPEDQPKGNPKKEPNDAPAASGEAQSE